MFDDKSIDQRPLVSIILPVLNVDESYLSRCVDSILTQTYENLEIILIHDGSAEQSDKLIDSYVEQDERIIRVEHKKNAGLFQARLSGAEMAHGKYIAFVDGNDYLSIDWFRLLVQKAEETQADIVVGEWCTDTPGKPVSYYSMDPFRVNDYMLEGENVLRHFMEQAGLCCSWTALRNKLYSIKLWKHCFGEFRRFAEKHTHMLWWEDIVFSSALWTRAKKVSNVHGICYFFFQPADAASPLDSGKKKNETYLRDSSDAMRFMASQLIATNTYSDMEKHYMLWKKRAAAQVYNDLVIKLRKKRLISQIREAFDQKGEFIELDTYFYHLTSTLESPFYWVENAKKQIVAPETKIISFDIFDTLLCRPFLEPDGLFQLLSDELNTGNSAYVNYYSIRKNAESICRQRKKLESPSCEEITFDEIYEEIARETVLSPAEVEKAKKRELELELSLCTARKTGRELFELAKFARKPIILCSDIYLPEKIVTELLWKNGYSGWRTIFLSSTVKKTKQSGNLFKYVLKETKVKNKKSVFHIGDNWIADVENAQKAGMSSVHFDRAANVFRNMNPGIYAGEFYTRAIVQNDRAGDYMLTQYGYPASQWMLALIANKFFDNPYISFNKNSDFNGNPAYIGYATLGPHLLALSKWIENNAEERHVGTVHFVARDGYLVRRAFDMLNRTSVRSNYIRLSRTSLLLADVETPADLYSLYQKFNIAECSPSRLVRYLSPLISKEKRAIIPEVMGAHSLTMESHFASETEFYTCLKLFINEILDFSLLPVYKKSLRKYFSEIIKPGDYIFDMGYSGRPEAALSNILGFPVGSFYIHTNSDVAEKRQRRYQTPNLCYYTCKPKITGVMREHLLMELGPSTIGYAEINGKLQPLLEEYEIDYCEAFVTSLFQENAIRFIEDYISIFGAYSDSMIIPQDFMSAPFEYYLHYSKLFDREIFSSVTFEDSLGLGEQVRALDFWNNEIAVRGLSGAEQGAAWFLPDVFRDMYTDGLFVKLYVKLNKWFPKGSRKREFVKKLASGFFR